MAANRLDLCLVVCLRCFRSARTDKISTDRFSVDEPNYADGFPEGRILSVRPVTEPLRAILRAFCSVD